MADQTPPTGTTTTTPADATKSPMTWQKIVLIIVGIVILLIVLGIIYRWYRLKKQNEPLLINDPVAINSVAIIPGSSAPLSANGIEYTYSFWIFVRDWSKGLGYPKCIMYRSNGDVNNFEVASPMFFLYPNENKLMIRVSTYPGSNYDNTTYPDMMPLNSENLPILNPYKWTTAQAGQLFNTNYVCDVSNIPIQKWVHITASLWNRTMDIYINGKLVRSCILPGVPVNDPTHLSNIYVGTPNGTGNTYNGYIARFKYFNRSITPSECLNLYLAGPYGANWWFNTVKTNLNVSLSMKSD